MRDLAVAIPAMRNMPFPGADQLWAIRPTQAGRPILVVEDDPDMAEIICGMLQREGWSVRHAATLADGFTALREYDPCIAIVDLGLPDGSGMNLVRAASARMNTGVIVVSGHDEEVDRLIGLEVGADDYIGKPFSQREMTARVRALYRRLGGDRPGQTALAQPESEAAAAQAHGTRPMLRQGEITLDPARLRITGPEGMVVPLTGGEAELLSMLIGAGEEPVPRSAMSDAMPGQRLQPEQRGIDRLASNLRQKLQSLPGSTMRITAVRGRGYRLLL